MKKYLFVVSAATICFFAACTNTTKETEEINSASMDSAVGNSDAANSIYRDSADIIHATESRGGTGNASNKNQSVPAQSMNADTTRR